MSADEPPPELTFSELVATDLQRERAGDVVDVIPHQHAGDSETTMSVPPYRWCLYTLPTDQS